MRQRLVTALLCVLGGLVGLMVAVVVTLNLHILVGLEEGYAATPAQVFERSIVLGLFDLALLVAAPALMALGILAARRRSGGPPGSSP